MITPRCFRCVLQFRRLLKSSQFFFHARNSGSNSNFDFAGIQPAPISQIHNAEHNERILSDIFPDGYVFPSESNLRELFRKFIRQPEILKLCTEQGLSNSIIVETYVHFVRHCSDSRNLSAQLQLLLIDLVNGNGHVTDLFPHFLAHSRLIFPFLEHLDEMKLISDLRHPAQWYPEARSVIRNVIYHSGPTNSGKTHGALNRFYDAHSGVYCCPLRLLAAEIAGKSKTQGVPCDLVTGDEKIYALDEGVSPHMACTVEMCPTNEFFDVAVIDEIQMVRDEQRGWAWTRALLGAFAEEVHVCGEPAGVDLVRRLVTGVGDHFQVKSYERLTTLEFLDKPLASLEEIQPGDCIVTFSKTDIFRLAAKLDRMGIECATIYGALPPGTRLMQAAKFNDPSNKCNVLLATDAIGMGLNLSIRRIVFHSLRKLSLTKKSDGERLLQVELITPSHARQVAGRAGRFQSQFEHGYVTTFNPEDLDILQNLIAQDVTPIQRAGLLPTADQFELFAYFLPTATFTQLVEIFTGLAAVNEDEFFLCEMTDFRQFAQLIQHIPLAIKQRYTLCCSPISPRNELARSVLLKMARRISDGVAMDADWLATVVGWPFETPRSLEELKLCECVFDAMDLYLWLSYRFVDMFPGQDAVRIMRRHLDQLIHAGLSHVHRTGAASSRQKQLAGHQGSRDGESSNVTRRRTKGHNAKRIGRKRQGGK